MTVTVERTGPWRTRPGWGISADLTPPEVVTERSLARLRRRLGLGLVALLVVVGGGYVLAARHHGAAESSLEAQQVEAARLHARVADFADISQTQASLTRLRAQIATLMTGDVDLDALMGRLSTSLPPGMTITSESVSFGAAGAAAATGATGDAAVDPTQPSTIGTIALSGQGRRLDDLAAYVDRLQAIRGVTDVVPTSNAATKSGVDYTATMSLTSDLLSHRYDATGTTP